MCNIEIVDGCSQTMEGRGLMCIHKTYISQYCNVIQVFLLFSHR